MMNVHLELFHTTFFIYIIMLNYTENSKKLIVNAKIIRNRTTGHTKNKTYKGVLQWQSKKKRLVTTVSFQYKYRNYAFLCPRETEFQKFPQIHTFSTSIYKHLNYSLGSRSMYSKFFQNVVNLQTDLNGIISLLSINI